MEALLEPVRRLLPADAEAFRAIRLEALATCPDAYATTLAKQAADPPAHFAEILRDSPVFGAFLEGGIVGMAGLYREFGERKQHKGVLWGMYVRPAAPGPRARPRAPGGGAGPRQRPIRSGSAAGGQRQSPGHPAL
ncbi:MAG TPA: hypothetical protein VF213_12920 [Dongiaceae bacterium]